LIEHASKDFIKIKQEYQDSLKKKSIPQSLQIDVKNLMENLRSSLDYLARDIYEKHLHNYRKSKGKREIIDIYFPYGKNEKDFKSSLGRSLPELDTVCPKIYTIIENIQPHKCGNDWLYNLCNILNQNKHNALTPQEQISKGTSYQVGPRGGQAFISAPAGAIKAPPGAIRIGNEPIIFNEETGIPIPTPGLDVKITKWVGFLFTGTNIEVLPLLETTTKELGRLSEEIYSNL
jgi:hypothetical protein